MRGIFCSDSTMILALSGGVICLAPGKLIWFISECLSVGCSGFSAIARSTRTSFPSLVQNGDFPVGAKMMILPAAFSGTAPW